MNILITFGDFKFSFSKNGGRGQIMALIGSMTSPIQGMLAQASAFGAISDNITNMNTGGFKTTDIRFKTVLASKFFNNGDVGGIMPIRAHNIEGQGSLNSTTNPLNLAISGKGFFIVKPQFDGTGDIRYTRDGNLELKNQGTETVNGFVRDNGDIDIISLTGENPISFDVDRAFLTDKNGNFLQGFLVDETGVVDDSRTVNMRVDQFAFISDSSATTTTTLINTLPSTAAPGSVERAKASVFDATGVLKSLEFVWTKGTAAQNWSLNVEPTAGTLTTITPTSFDFSSSGELPNPTTSSFNITWDDGQTSEITTDISLTRSIGSTFFYSEFQKNGRSPGDLQDFSFDHNGNVNGRFSNGVVRPLYKIPLATFANTNRLAIEQGNLFSETPESGTALVREVDKLGVAQLVPFFNEVSNVNLGSEFQTMILVQQAYNSSATVFKTVDEMISQAADLKR